MAAVAARLATLVKEREESTRSRVITVRMPPSLHARLKDAAHASRASLNRICIAALLEAADELAPQAEEASPC